MECVGNSLVPGEQRLDRLGLRMVRSDFESAQAVSTERYRLGQIDAGGSQLLTDQLGKSIDGSLQFGRQ